MSFLSLVVCKTGWMPLAERILAEGLRDLDQVACKAFRVAFSSQSLIFREMGSGRGE